MTRQVVPSAELCIVPPQELVKLTGVALVNLAVALPPESIPAGYASMNDKLVSARVVSTLTTVMLIVDTVPEPIVVGENALFRIGGDRRAILLAAPVPAGVVEVAPEVWLL